MVHIGEIKEKVFDENAHVIMFNNFINAVKVGSTYQAHLYLIFSRLISLIIFTTHIKIFFFFVCVALCVSLRCKQTLMLQSKCKYSIRYFLCKQKKYNLKGKSIAEMLTKVIGQLGVCVCVWRNLQEEFFNWLGKI